MVIFIISVICFANIINIITNDHILDSFIDIWRTALGNLDINYTPEEKCAPAISLSQLNQINEVLGFT